MSGKPLAQEHEENVLDRVRQSCAAFKSSLARVSDTGVQVFSSKANASTIKQAGESLAVSGLSSFGGLVEFASMEEEVSFLTATHALDFGSGFRLALHQFHGKGAWQTIKAGMIRMHSANNRLEASFLTNATKASIQSWFLPGFDTAAPEVAANLELLVSHLLRATRSLGEGLEQRGLQELHQVVFKSVENTTTPAAAVVAALVESFPVCFDDAYSIQVDQQLQQVYFYKKAQLVTGELYHRFRTQVPRLDFPDASSLTCFCDNVIVAMMRSTGCIECADELTTKIETDQPIEMGSEEEVALRASALDAVERISRALNVNACEIGNYLWGVLGKEPNFRVYKRHATPSTLFY
mmetsp:Transcript_5719/g.10251  ORF Transcript_5719/g.10251 Transcript_5719/m.10251 type:complete len:352 (+) Transcript_5719:278-1333(+)